MKTERERETENKNEIKRSGSRKGESLFVYFTTAPVDETKSRGVVGSL